MPGFFDILVAHHKKNKERARNYDYFKACMAGAALAAMADDELVRREDATLQKLMKVVSELKLFGQNHGDELFKSFVSDIRENPEKGRAKALEAVSAAKSDEEWMTTLLILAATITEADGALDQVEKDTMVRIGRVLGFDQSMIEAMELDIKDEIYK